MAYSLLSPFSFFFFFLELERWSRVCVLGGIETNVNMLVYRTGGGSCATMSVRCRVTTFKCTPIMWPNKTCWCHKRLRWSIETVSLDKIVLLALMDILHACPSRLGWRSMTVKSVDFRSITHNVRWDSWRHSNSRRIDSSVHVKALYRFSSSSVRWWRVPWNE